MTLIWLTPKFEWKKNGCKANDVIYDYSVRKWWNEFFLVPPKLAPLPRELEFRRGERFQLVCSCREGEPPLTFSWVRDGQALLETAEVQVRRFDEFSSSITISALREDQAGNYTCIVSNRGGSDSSTVKLRVLGKYKASVFPGRTDWKSFSQHTDLLKSYRQFLVQLQKGFSVCISSLSVYCVKFMIWTSFEPAYVGENSERRVATNVPKVLQKSVPVHSFPRVDEPTKSKWESA